MSAGGRSGPGHPVSLKGRVCVGVSSVRSPAQRWEREPAQASQQQSALEATHGATHEATHEATHGPSSWSELRSSFRESWRPGALPRVRLCFALFGFSGFFVALVLFFFLTIPFLLLRSFSRNSCGRCSCVLQAGIRFVSWQPSPSLAPVRPHAVPGR